MRFDYQPTNDEISKADALVQLLQSKTPAQIDAHVDALFPQLSDQQRKFFATLAKLAIYK